MTGARPTALDPELFLPEPAPREVWATIISVDDHVVEPPHMFEGRLPSRLAERAPKIVEFPNGQQIWEFDGGYYSQVGMNAVAGRRPETVEIEPFRFDQMRPGCFDIEARIADMDLNGVWGSLNFPSQITGFCGRVFFDCSDPDLGKATIRAWNDWIHDEWYEPHPDRIIACGVAYLTDPVEAAAEIRRNAGRGFRSVSLPERPHKVGLPPIFDRQHWGPIIDACVETDTVISLHVGSSGVVDLPEGSPAVPLAASLFGQLSLTSCAEWLWSAWPLEQPDLKICMSEGGIGWVAMLIDRLDNVVDRSGYGKGWEVRPAEVLRRNFWFCTIDDPSTIDTRDVIGVENICVETDYPHGDSTWPDTQQVLREAWGHLGAAELRAICSENAATLFRHPLPADVLPAG
ncbi:MAG TPA: amidohydrolase family protein [Acidimicrobiales bacterium]